MHFSSNSGRVFTKIDYNKIHIYCANFLTNGSIRMEIPKIYSFYDNCLIYVKPQDTQK